MTGFLATLPVGVGAKGAALLPRVGRGAGFGALSALGFGDADTAEDAVVDVAGGAVLGGALGGLAPLLPAAVGRVVEKAKNGKAKAAELALKAAEEAEEYGRRGGLGGYAGGKGKKALADVVENAKPTAVDDLIGLTNEEWERLMASAAGD